MSRRLLFVLNSLAGGGAEKVFINLINNLDKSKYIIDVLLMENHGVYLHALPSHVNVIFMKDQHNDIVNLPFCDDEVKKLYDLNIKENYDVEIAFIEGPATKFIANSTNANSKKYAWIHTDLPMHHYTKYIFKSDEDEELHYLKFDKIFCVSTGATQSVARLFPKIQDKLETLTNNIDIPEVMEKANRFDVIYKKLTFIVVARLHFGKGHLRLLKAINALLNLGYDFNLEIFGIGDMEGEIIKFIYDNKLNNNVHLHGFAYNPYPYIKSANLLILTSFAEGYSTVMSEAMILGTPVAGTEIVGLMDVMGNGEFGYLLGNTDKSIFNRLKFILDNKNMLEELKTKAELGAKRFGIDITLSDYEKYFMEE
ncbi:MAG: glycosyltransferase [Bacillota bacterium]